VIEIREAVVDDAEAMAEVNAAGWRHGYSEIVPKERLAHLPVGKWRREMTHGLEEPRGDSFTRIGELDGRFAGYCFVEAPGREEPDDSRTSELVAMYVDPANWGKGIGSALISIAIADTERLGYEQMLLWTFERNERARSFYANHGFATDGERRPFVPIGAETVRMRRALR